MGKKTKIVIDTNVIISAFGWHGTPEDIVRLVDRGEVVNFTCIEMLAELRNTVSYPRLRFPEELQVEIVETIFNISSIVILSESLNIVEDDQDDNMVVECALSAKADFIISGDKHLISIRKFRDIEILTPEGFLTRRGLKK